MADLDPPDLSTLILEEEEEEEEEEANIDSLDHSTLVLEVANRVEQIGSLAALRSASRSLLMVCDEATTKISLKGGPGNGALIKRLWNLTRLHANSSCEMHEAMLLVPLAVHGKLLHIQMKNNPSITTLEALGECKVLQSLDLSRCQGLTSVDALGGCKALQSLNLYNCYRLTSMEALRE